MIRIIDKPQLGSCLVILAWLIIIGMFVGLPIVSYLLLLATDLTFYFDYRIFLLIPVGLIPFAIFYYFEIKSFHIAFKLQSYLNQEKYDDVIQLVDKFLPSTRQKFKAGLITFKCSALLKKSNYLAAKEHCKECNRDYPTYPYAWYCLACVNAMTDHLEDAIIALEKAIKIKSEFKKYARNDPDLIALYNIEQFQKLVGV